MWSLEILVFVVAGLSPTLIQPMDCGPSGSSLRGISQARILGVGYHFQFPVLFLPFCRAEFLHTITFLQPEKSSFKIFCRTDLMVVNSLSICSSWNIFTLLSFGRAFFLDRWCTGDSLLLWHFIDVAVSSALLCFWWASESVSRWVMSDSLRPHGLWLARLLCPWNSPGKNTGVGCRALLQGIFPTQGWNPGLPHCCQILYCLSH